MRVELLMLGTAWFFLRGFCLIAEDQVVSLKALAVRAC